MEKNDSVKRAPSVLHEMSEDEKLRRLAELREKAILEEESVRDGALEEGMEIGRKAGRQEGEQEEKIAIAKKMKEEELSIEQIQRITGLTREAIEKL